MLSYRRGPEADLLEWTIQETFSRTVSQLPRSRRPDRPSSGSPLHVVATLEAAVERTARGLAGHRETGRAHRHLGAELRRMDPAAVRGRRALESSWSTSTPPTARTNSRMCCAARASRLSFCANPMSAPAIARSSSTRPTARISRSTTPSGSAPSPGSSSSTAAAMCPPSPPRPRTSPISSTPPAPRARRRAYCSRTATSSTTGSFIGHVAAYLRARPHLRPGAPVSLLRLRHRQHGHLTSGAAMILPADRFHALPTMEAIAGERCTLVYGVPTMFIAQLNHPGVRGLRLLEPARRHHGRRSLPGRDHEASS